MILIVLLPASPSRCWGVALLPTLDCEGRTGAGEPGLHGLLVAVGGDQLPLPHPLDRVLDISELADFRLKDMVGVGGVEGDVDGGDVVVGLKGSQDVMVVRWKIRPDDILVTFVASLWTFI